VSAEVLAVGRARDEVASGMSCLAAGDALLAALHFGVALRQAPSIASAVLIAIGDRQDPPLLLVRGEALKSATAAAAATQGASAQVAAPEKLKTHEVPSIRWE